MTGIPKVALTTELGPSAPPASRPEAIAASRAATAFMHAQIGKILASLNKLNLEQNTIVVLIGDNGLGSKHTLFERATRVPIIFAAPGISKVACSRTAHWRYFEWQPANQGLVESVLYDHRNDPAEFTNLPALPTYAATLRSLRDMLHSSS